MKVRLGGSLRIRQGFRCHSRPSSWLTWTVKLCSKFRRKNIFRPRSMVMTLFSVYSLPFLEYCLSALVSVSAFSSAMRTCVGRRSALSFVGLQVVYFLFFLLSATVVEVCILREGEGGAGTAVLPVLGVARCSLPPSFLSFLSGRVCSSNCKPSDG